MNTLTIMKEPNSPAKLVLETFESDQWIVFIKRPRQEGRSRPRLKPLRSSPTPPSTPRAVTLKIGNRP